VSLTQRADREEMLRDRVGAMEIAEAQLRAIEKLRKCG
jgi:hypothetical protein